MQPTTQEIVIRNDAWLRAEDIVNNVTKDHPLEEMVVSSAPLTSHRVSAAEQRVDLIERVANWLLRE